MKTLHATKWTRSGCSTFFPDLPDHWYDIRETPIPIPKDTARKKTNQTYRAHAQTRKVLFVLSKKVKVNAQGSASKNQKVKVKGPKPPVVNGVDALGLAESTGESKDYFVERLLGKLTIKEEKPAV